MTDTPCNHVFVAKLADGKSETLILPAASCPTCLQRRIRQLEAEVSEWKQRADEAAAVVLDAAEKGYIQ